MPAIPATQEAGAKELSQVLGQPGQLSKVLLQNKIKNRARGAASAECALARHV